MSKSIWVVLQHADGKLHRMSKEAIAAGQQLATEVGGSVTAALVGSGISDLAREVAGFDLAGVVVVDHEALADYTPGGYGSVLGSALRAARPDYVVFPHTYQSVDYVPRLAQETDAAFVPEVVAFETVDGEILFTRPILTGKLQSRVRVKGEGTVFLSVQSAAFSADAAAAGSCAAEALADAGEPIPDRELLGVETVGGDQVDLTKTDVVVAVGRGVGKPENIEPIRELAEVLGADIGASRPVIDSGWLERERQIGSSGQTVAPKLYVAIGISGAIQHLVGMKGSSCVVSINKDPSAPIFTVSKYGLIGDLHEIVPALTEAVREAKAS
ncbi:MAG: electron transfer flavoprotein subunit alpha/FixB family protein [Acidobacteriota bacterium]